MKVFDRSGGSPQRCARAPGWLRGEKVLAHGRAQDGTWLLGTRTRFVVVPDQGEVASIPRERVEDAAWELDATTLTVSEIGEYGERRPSYVFVLEDPALLLQLVRERVTASIVLQRRVPVRGKLGLTGDRPAKSGGRRGRLDARLRRGSGPVGPGGRGRRRSRPGAGQGRGRGRRDGSDSAKRTGDLLGFAGAIPCSSIGRAFDC